MSNEIKQLCKEYTDLSKEEVQVIEMMAQTLQPLANLEAADIFIDCPCREGDAIVVAEAKPEDVPSSYKGSVVAMMALEENEPAVARTLKLGIATKYMKARTQENNYTIQSVEPIKYHSRVIGVLIRERRITDDSSKADEQYKAVEIPLNHMINENEWLTESIDEGLILVDANDNVIFRNAYAKELFQALGYVVDILGQKYKNIRLTGNYKSKDFGEVISEVKIGSHYLRIRQIKLDKGDIRLAVIVRDITWNREQEKNLMLKSKAIEEINHRVKNNLQTVASLLRMQARRTDNEETKQHLGASINRILSIAATHQLLAHSAKDEVSLKEVLKKVMNNVLQSLVETGQKMHMEIIGDDMMVNSDIATSAAIAVTELLSNSIKHAFSGSEEGNIHICIEQGQMLSKITVSDDGKGFDVRQKEPGSMGLELVKSMVRDKLHGYLKIRSDDTGTKVSFEFMNQTEDLINFLE